MFDIHRIHNPENISSFEYEPDFLMLFLGISKLETCSHIVHIEKHSGRIYPLILVPKQPGKYLSYASLGGYVPCLGAEVFKFP